jgi:hypothetical protein
MLQNPIILAALIAFVGALVSISASLVITFLSNRSEIRKLRTSLRNQHSTIILEKRLNAYMGCYYILSNFVKIARGFVMPEGPLTRNDVKKLNEALNDWDSKSALLLSPRSVVLIHTLRHQVRDFLNKFGADTSDISEDSPELEQLIIAIGKLEMGLKNDVGIFDVEKYEDKKFHMSNKQFLNNTLSAALPDMVPEVDQKK